MSNINSFPIPTTPFNASTLGVLQVANNLSDVADASASRTNLGLAIGTNVQAYSADLTAIAGLTSAADRLPYYTGSQTAALATFTGFARNLLDDADAATARTTLGVPGGAIDENITGVWTGMNARSFAALKSRSVTGLTNGALIDVTDPFRDGQFEWVSGDQSALVTAAPVTVQYANAASTNQIRNPRGAGFTSSTAPTNWSIVGNGGYAVSYARARRNGVAGIDVTFAGTGNGTTVQLNFEGNQQIDAVAGETWTGSLYFATVGVFPAPAANLTIFERAEAGGFVASENKAMDTSATAKREDITRALTGVTTAHVNLGFTCIPPNGSAGFTVFLAFPQLDESATPRPISAPAWGASLAASSATNLIEVMNHGILQAERVRFGGVDYWAERVNSFQLRLHTTLASVYDNNAAFSPPSVTPATDPAQTFARLLDPGEARIVTPASDNTGASGVWRRVPQREGVNFLWCVTNNTERGRAEALQNAISAANNEPVIIPNSPGLNSPWVLDVQTVIQKTGITLRGLGRNISVLWYPDRIAQGRVNQTGLFFQHPDVPEVGQFTWLQNVGTVEMTVWGHTAIDAITYDCAAASAHRFSVTANPFRGVLMRGAQGHNLDTFSVFTNCETPNAACVRAEERPLYGGEDYQPFYPSVIKNTLLGGDTTETVAAVITGITQADPGVVTTNIAHGLQNGWEVQVNSVGGMTEVNARVYRVANVTSTTFELTDPYTFADVDTTGFTTYTSGGTLTRVRRCDYLFSCNRSDGLNLSDIYWGSCRRAYVHLDPSREGGGASGGVFLVHFNDYYFDGVSFGPSPRSPQHIVHITDANNAGGLVSNIRFNNGIFANNRTPGSQALFKCDASGIGEVHFSNTTFFNSNEELIVVDNGGTARGTFLFDDACSFGQGGLGVDGANLKPMMRFNGVGTLSLGGAVGDSATGQARVKLEGNVNRLMSTAAFAGTNADFDVSAATIVQEAVVVGPSAATTPYKSLGARGNLTPVLVIETPGATPPSYTTQTGSWQRFGNFVVGRARVTLSAKGDGSGGVDVRLTAASGFSSVPVATATTPVNLTISPTGSGVLDKGVSGFVVGTVRDVRLSRPNSAGSANQRIAMADLADNTLIDISFMYQVA